MIIIIHIRYCTMIYETEGHGFADDKFIVRGREIEKNNSGNAVTIIIALRYLFGGTGQVSPTKY